MHEWWSGAPEKEKIKNVHVLWFDGYWKKYLKNPLAVVIEEICFKTPCLKVPLFSGRGLVFI